jgi:hypothetical protein
VPFTSQKNPGFQAFNLMACHSTCYLLQLVQFLGLVIHNSRTRGVVAGVLDAGCSCGCSCGVSLCGVVQGAFLWCRVVSLCGPVVWCGVATSSIAYKQQQHYNFERDAPI